MGADHDDRTGSARIFTSHGTTLFVDTSSGELRHGSLESVPFNTVLTERGVEASLTFVGAEAASLIDTHPFAGGPFILAGFTGREFGLKKDALFLCAEPDGRVTLSRTECKKWELFHYRQDPSETSGTIVSHRIDGKMVSFFITDRADYIQSCLLRGDFYDRGALDLIRRKMLQGKVFVDVGANIGNHSIFVSKFCNPSEVIAFEPNPTAAIMLKINTMINSCENINLNYLGLALSSNVGRMRIFYPSHKNMGGAQMLSDDDGEVRSIPGDDLLYQKPIGFMKIDVEGAEFEVLKGLKNTIELWRPNVLIEVWPQRLNELHAWCTAFRYTVQECLPMDDNYFLIPEEND